MNRATSSPNQLIDKLKQDWDQLSDPDRALAIARIKKSGLSNRKIAAMLERSENTIRRLLLLLRATGADLAAARNGTISTNELLRRTDAALQKRTVHEKASIQRQRRRQAVEGAKLISDWLKKHNLAGAYGEQIIAEARRLMIDAIYSGTLPHVDPPSRPVPSDVIIKRCKPKESLGDDINPSGWYSAWLARWIIFVFLHPDVRDQALEISLEQQQKQ